MNFPDGYELILRPNTEDVKSYLGGIMIKKTALAIAIAATSLGLVACGHSTTKDSHSVSSSSSNKVVKHHHKKRHQRSQSSSASSSSSTNQANHQSQSQASNVQSTQSSESSQPAAWSSQQQTRNQAAQNGGPTTEDQARAMLGGANGDLQATRTSNGWTFSGDGYTATVGDDGSVEHN